MCTDPDTMSSADHALRSCRTPSKPGEDARNQHQTMSSNLPHPSFTARVIETIRGIPVGRVATYGQIAALAGNRRAARQVVRILHTQSRKESLPWHRVVNREGRIALGAEQGGAEQRQLLAGEGIEFDQTGRIDLERFLWIPKRQA